VSDTVRAVLHGLDPMPAALTNSRFDVIESNAAHADLFADWHSLPCVHLNLLWCVLTEPRAPDRLLDYDREVGYLVGRLRAAYGGHVGDPAWEEDLRRLRETSPEFADRWDRHEVTAPRDRVLRFRHPDAGELTFHRTELTFPSAPGLHIAVYSPYDAATRDNLSSLRR
jgi:hypothetical protein